MDIERVAIFVLEQDFFDYGNLAIINKVEQYNATDLAEKLDYLVNYAAPRLVAAHPKSLVGEMIIDEALEEMYLVGKKDGYSWW